MKLAILGSSAQALETAVRFHLHGASFTWFQGQEMGLEVLSQAELPSLYLTSSEGLQLLGSIDRHYRPENFTWAHWKEHYYNPLVALLSSEQKVRKHEVVSISKRYLAPLEEIPGKSRFYDLFRIIFQVNPEEFIKEQEATNPETFQRLTEELKTSLQKNIEMYEDFDLVLDLRRSTWVRSLSVTGRALGEQRVSSDQLMYGYAALNEAHKIAQHTGEVREIALVGTTELAVEIALTLHPWLKDQRMRLFIVSTEAEPFSDWMKNARPELNERLQMFLQDMESEFAQEIEEFHRKLREWQELDDFVQVKIPKPAEPIPRLVFFSGHNATAVDQLIDKRRLFLTLEKPDFRHGLKQPENNALELKTIGVDRIFVATKLEKPPIECHVAADEKGFFSIELTHWDEDLNVIEGIEDEIFKLFSPAGTH